MVYEYVSESEKEMSRSIDLELTATDSQVLGSLDSGSLASEPPNIRNWFPSYVYESPELNTLDGFLDSDGNGKAFLKEEKNGKSRENQPVEEFNDGLLAAAKESTDGIVKCNEYNEFRCSKSAAMVTGSSESLTFSSEPPDITNWFSSYSYESPELDTHEFTIFDHKEREDGNFFGGQKICIQDNKDVIDFIDVKDGAELPSCSRTSDIVAKSTTLVTGTKLDCPPDCEDAHNGNLKPIATVSSQSTSEKVSEKILRGEMTENNNHGSVDKFRNKNKNGEYCEAMLNRSLINRTSPEVLKMENNPCSQDGKCVHKLFRMKNRANDILETEDLHEIGPNDRRITGKENDRTGLLESGFISTRKKSSEDTGIVTRCVNRVKPEFNCKKDAAISKKVLSDVTNFYFPNVVANSGKWLCPQKRKPNLGPPLKQLRLERWVRRV